MDVLIWIYLNFVLHSVIMTVPVRYRTMARNMISPNLRQNIQIQHFTLISPIVELHAKVNYGNANVDKGWHDGEDKILQQVVDGGGPPVHHPQHLPCLPRHVPLQAQLVNVPKQTNLDL